MPKLPEGHLMGVNIIPGAIFGEMAKAARDGDEDARFALLSIRQWLRRTDEALDRDIHPDCIRCKEILFHGDVGGWAIIRPRFWKPGDIGLVMAFCKDCIQINEPQLVRDLVKAAN